MKIVTLTEFRSHASGMLTQVEHGETILVLRHGRPIAEVSPVEDQKNSTVMEKPRPPSLDEGLGTFFCHFGGANT